MFFISESNNNLTIESVNNKDKPADCQVIIINTPKQVTVIGKNSVYDNHIQPYVYKHSLTFFGKEYVHLNDEVELAIYQMKNDEGYVVHDKNQNLVYVSRSFSKIIDYCLTLGFSILGIIRHIKGSDANIPSITINNDFSRAKLRAEDINADDHLSFDFGWDVNEDYLNFNMVIEQKNYVVNKDGMFFEEYKGFVPNIGQFRYINLKELDADQKTPEVFPEQTLDKCAVFTNLINDDAQSVLVPNVLSLQEYSSMINEMKRIGRKQVTLSAMHKHGYGVQAFISLLGEEEAVGSYQAKVTHLIVAPHDMFIDSQIFK